MSGASTTAMSGARLLLLGCCLLLACGRSAAPPNIVLIVIDTLRWDHVGAYGAASRDVSPQIDAFASSALRFERAYASAPWTRPSIGSMITGLHPSSHGGTSVDRPLPEAAHTLAEILSERGYATRAVVSNWVISRQNGFAQGFDVYQEGAAAVRKGSTSARVSELALEMLDQLAERDEPFLLFVHYFDPHYRYLHHEDVGFAAGEVGRVASEPSIFQIRALGPDLEAAEITNLRDLYAEEVRHTDDQVGRLLAAIERKRLAERTIVALLSDHGEEIFERGYLGHAHSLHEELLRIPLLIRAPGQAPGVVGRVVSAVSLTPTLLELAGLDAGGLAFQGRSLLPLMRGERGAEGDGFVFAEVDYLPDKRVERTARQRTLVGDRFKLVRDSDSEALALFDLERDPDERDDLAQRKPERVAQLLPLLEERIHESEARAVEAPARTLTSGEIDLLEELGYVEPEP